MWIRFFLAITFALFLTENTSAAIISEVLPNTENDTLLESITLKNNSCVPEDISLYSLTDASGKVFIIPSGTILSSFSEQKFFRPETKITLNNENESLFLRNTSGTLLDTFSYVTSIKNTVIFQTVSNEMCVPTSGSGTVDSGSGAVVSGSGAVDPEDNVADSGNSTDPDTSGDSTEYSDPVEWNIAPEITGSGTQIEDENLVSSGSFGEPGSFSGTLSDSWTLSQSGSGEFGSGTGIISSGSNSGSTSSGAVLETNSGTTLTASGVLAHIHVQSGLDGDLRCYKEDCSVNFEFPSPKSTDSCTWNFGGGISSTEDVSKCNPSYVHYSYGTYQVRLRVCHALGTCSEDTIVLRVIDPEASSGVSSSTSVSSSTTASTTSSATSVTSSGITTSSTSLSSISSSSEAKVLTNPGYTPPRIVFSPDAKGEVDSQGNISALCDTSSKKICQISITPLIFEEDSWKGWSSRWILPNSSKRYTKVLKGILPTLKEETYIFEMFSRENSKSFRFSIKVRKRLVEVVETFEGQADEVVVAASGDTQKTKAKTTPKTTKTPKTSAKTTATKTTKTSSGSTASTASKTKTSSLETGTKSTEDNNIKVLLLFAASILSFGLGLSISRLFLPERGKWISSGNSDEDS